jgi:hypothetical protein
MTTSNKSALISTIVTLLSLVVLARPGVAQTYSAAVDFSDSSNPNGAWSYGYSYGVGSTFIPDTTNTASYGPGLALGGWMGNVDSSPGANYPYALKNFTANPVANNGTTVYQPGQLGLQPGSSNEDSIVRWTAPFSGTFNIAVTFSAMDSFGDSTDVHVLRNGSSLFNSMVLSGVFGSPSTVSFSVAQSVLAGDTIDFVVGNDGNGLNNDTTALTATIVPEPGTFTLVAMSLAGLLSFRFFKRK